MNHFEEYIAEWYDTIPEGGGTAASPWKIEWNDVPYKERDTRPLSRLKVLGAMKEVLFNGTPIPSIITTSSSIRTPPTPGT